MKVKRMIELLSKFNGNADLRLHERNGEPVLFVIGVKDDDKTVWLETESDADIADEIQARFDTAIENGLDECDVYSEMLEDGIDVDMVRRYMEKETAEHMQVFCKEHGLLGESEGKITALPISVPTPVGEIRVEVKTDTYYPGVYINLHGTNVKGSFEKNTVPLAIVEYEPNKEHVQTVVYGDAEKDDPTYIECHKLNEA